VETTSTIHIYTYISIRCSDCIDLEIFCQTCIGIYIYESNHHHYICTYKHVNVYVCCCSNCIDLKVFFQMCHGISQSSLYEFACVPSRQRVRVVSAIRVAVLSFLLACGCA